MNRELGIGSCWGVATVVALSIAALASRLIGLDSQYVIDELYTALDYSNRIKGTLNPSYYVLVAGSHALFGDSEFATRLPAALLGAAAIPVMYSCGSRLFNRRVGVFAAIILLFSSWHLMQSQMGRFYSGVFLFALLAIYFYCTAHRTESVPRLVASLIFIAVAASFHPTAIFLGIGFGAHSIIFLLGARGGLGSIKVAKALLFVGAIGGLFVLPTALGLVSRWSGSGYTSDTYASVGLALQLAKYVGIPLVGFSLAGIISEFVRRSEFSLFFLTVILTTVLPMLVASEFMAIRPRYGIYILIVMALYAAIWCDRMASASESSEVARAMPIAALIISMMPTFASHYTSRATLDIRDALAFVASQFEEGDEVIALTRAVEYYLPAGLPLAWREDGYNTTVDWRQSMQKFVCPPNRYWLVTRTGRGPLSSGLESWLFEHSRLVWRQSALRFDRDVEGFEVWQVDGSRGGCPNSDSQNDGV